MTTLDTIIDLLTASPNQDRAIEVLYRHGWDVDRTHAEQGNEWLLIDPGGHHHLVEYNEYRCSWSAL